MAPFGLRSHKYFLLDGKRQPRVKPEPFTPVLEVVASVEGRLYALDLAELYTFSCWVGKAQALSCGPGVLAASVLPPTEAEGLKNADGGII